MQACLSLSLLDSMAIDDPYSAFRDSQVAQW